MAPNGDIAPPKRITPQYIDELLKSLPDPANIPHKFLVGVWAYATLMVKLPISPAINGMTFREMSVEIDTTIPPRCVKVVSVAGNVIEEFEL